MNNAETKAWLDSEWRRITDSDTTIPDPEVDAFVNSSTVAIRYAFVTQLLGKVTDGSRSLLYLQSGTNRQGAWNARSFASAVVAPWVADNHDVLGTSADPYVSKPLRRPRLVRDMPDVRNKSEWRNMVVFFESLESEGPDAVRTVFERCLKSIARRLARQQFRYQIPKRVSMTDLASIMDTFLADASQGLRPMAVTTALIRTLGRAFSLFSEVVSQGLNESDRASGMPGDIMCYDRSGVLSLVVEVKGRDLTIADVRDSIRKARKEGSRLSSLLFAAPGIKRSESGELESAIQRAWASGLNIYYIDVKALADAAFPLLAEDWRTEFMRETGNELDKCGDHRHRKAWHDLLSGLSESR